MYCYGIVLYVTNSVGFRCFHGRSVYHDKSVYEMVYWLCVIFLVFGYLNIVLIVLVCVCFNK